MVDAMKNFSQAEADAFAREWAAAWNSHDVDLIVGHYRHDIQYYSPFAARLGASTPLSGRSELRRYVAAALERYPSVRFGPELVAAAGAGSITIGYLSVDNLFAIETLAIDDHGLITLARCHYRKRHLVGWFTSPPDVPERDTEVSVDAMSNRRARPVTSASTAVISEERPVAVVTGAGRGIGRLLARRLSDAGYAVALVARSQQELRETARLVEIAGGRALCLAADVTDEEGAPEVIRRVETELGPIELLVNNAGILGPTGPTWEVDIRAWWRTVDINLFGTLVYTRLALALMVPRRRGRIVNITSQAGAFRWPTVSAYSVSKAAMIKLTENLAIEARRHKISIFSIHPGLLPIGLAESALTPDALPGTHDARLYTWAQRELNAGRGAEPDRAIEQIYRLTTGRYDELSGRHISVHDDLDEILRHIHDVRDSELYLLGMHRLAV